MLHGHSRAYSPQCASWWLVLGRRRSIQSCDTLDLQHDALEAQPLERHVGRGGTRIGEVARPYDEISMQRLRLAIADVEAGYFQHVVHGRSEATKDFLDEVHADLGLCLHVERMLGLAGNVERELAAKEDPWAD